MLAEAPQVVVAWYVLHVFVMMAVPACLVVHTTRIRALLEPLREAVILLPNGGDVLLELDIEVGGVLEVLLQVVPFCFQILDLVRLAFDFSVLLTF